MLRGQICRRLRLRNSIFMALDKKLLPNNGKTPEALSDFDLADYLIEHPERTDCVRFDRMNSEAWEKLLSHCPEFADKCNFYKLSKESASTLVCRYPEWRVKPYFYTWAKHGKTF